MKLIDKDALVAEIERRKEEEVNYDENGGYASWADHNHFSTLDSIQDFLNTIEVKEMDLDKEFSQWWKNERAKDYTVDILYERYSNVSMKLAKHFYKLGLKAQKGE